MRNFTHDLIERNVGLLLVLVILTISVGGLVEIVPLFFQKSTTEAVAGMKPACDPTSRRSVIISQYLTAIDQPARHAA